MDLGAMARHAPIRVATGAAFSTGLLALYLRSPALHKPGSVWPTFDGIAFSKDVWMFGIGLSLLTDAVIEAWRHRV